MRNRATPGDVVPEAQVAGTGFEREPFPPGNRHISPEGGAKCGALLPDSIMADDEALREVIRAWPNLPAVIKTGILAMVRAGRDG